MDIAVLYLEDYGTELFEELILASQSESLAVETEGRKNQPMANLEWMVIPAIAIYIAKPFIDKFLAKAAEDSVSIAYPKFKAAVQALVIRIFKHDRSKFAIISSGKNKGVDEGAWIFGIYSVTRNNQRIKFIFDDKLNEGEYQHAIDQMFDLLRQHHLEGTEDDITLGIRALPNSNCSDIFLLYDRQNQKWRAVDPLTEMRRIKDGNTNRNHPT